jgi:hypothetical protein
MSHAFIRDSDEQWLDEISPTLNALVNYLTRENNGIKVYEKKRYLHPGTGKEVYSMSNGMDYSIDEQSKWYVVD